MKVRKLLILRHPETEANVAGRWVGRGDSPYTERGQRQALLLAEEIARFGPEELWSSSLRRCREITETASAALEITPIWDDRLLEMDFGQVEGLTYAETVERGIVFDFKSEDAPVAPGAESRREILLRTADVLDAMLAGDAQRIVVVTHGGVVRSTIPHLLDLPISSIWSFHIANAAYLEYRIIDGHCQVSRFGHLG